MHSHYKLLIKSALPLAQVWLFSALRHSLMTLSSPSTPSPPHTHTHNIHITPFFHSTSFHLFAYLCVHSLEISLCPRFLYLVSSAENRAAPSFPSITGLLTEHQQSQKEGRAVLLALLTVCSSQGLTVSHISSS